MSKWLRYYRTAERPSLEIWWQDDDGTLIDFSTGYTWSLKIGNVGSAALLTKTVGITGAVGAGVEPTGTPNVTVAWTTGELDLAAGNYELQLTATASGVDRVLTTPIQIIDVIT